MEKRQTNFEINFNKINTITLPDPYGFNLNIVESSEARSRLRNTSLMKANKAKDLAYGQFKSIFMTLLSFYFIAGNLSLFTIFIVGLYGYNSLTSILNVNNLFKPFENHEFSIWQYKLIYIAVQSLVVVFILYKIHGMGLLPLNPADWISLLDHSIPSNQILNL